ncbi:MAG: class I SAM-dependent methyltransferase [Hyphomicrobiales bacterium]|nr:class I SAM-dependent methyltransferase [Hyphomicrobiales bacterium]
MSGATIDHSAPTASAPGPVAPFLPDRFHSAVPFYVEGRLDYSRRLIQHVAASLRLSTGAHVLDLGCGPGFLAIAFAELGCTALGIDPNKGMLAAARELAAKHAVSCEFREGSSYGLGPELGRFKLVTMGRSFHWMDRAGTLRALDAIVEPRGAVALFGDHHVKCRENNWVEAFEAARLRFEGRDEFTRLRKSGKIDGHETVLIDSAFACLDRLGVVERRTVSIEALVARALSYSASSPEKLGNRRLQFEAAVREAISPFAENRSLTELVEFSALVAQRPQSAG